MTTSYDVRIHSIERYKGKNKTTYAVRWVVAGKRFRETFSTSALADSFRAQIVTASRVGEAFETDTGRPLWECPKNGVTGRWVSCRWWG